MFAQPRLSKSQYEYFSSLLRTIAEGIILGSSAAFFLPEVLQMKESISATRYLIFFFVGLILVIIGAILKRKGNKK